MHIIDAWWLVATMMLQLMTCAGFAPLAELSQWQLIDHIWSKCMPSLNAEIEADQDRNFARGPFTCIML